MPKSERQALKRSVRLSGREGELRRHIYKRRTEERLWEAGIRVERCADVKEGTKECHEQAHGDPAYQFAPTGVEGNFTVHGGDGLVIIDIDVSIDELPDWVRNLPETFFVRSPHGGYHLYYVVEDDVGLSNTKTEWGSVRYGWYGVGPGSIIDHERCDDGKEGCPGQGVGWYTISCDKQITTLTDDHLDQLRDACDTDDGNNGERTEEFESVTEPDKHLVQYGEECIRDFQVNCKGLAFNDLMDLLNGGTGSIDGLRRDDGSIDRNRADSEALWLLYGVMLYAGEDKDRAARLTDAVYTHYCIETSYGKDGRPRKWRTRGDQYRRNQRNDAVEAFDGGSWYRWLRRREADGIDQDEPRNWSDEYSNITYDIVDAAVVILCGELPMEAAEQVYELDTPSPPPTDRHKIPPGGSAGSYGDSGKCRYPTPSEVYDLAVDLDSRSKETYKTAYQRLRREGQLKLACLEEGVDYRVYPAYLPDPAGAKWVKSDGEEREPEPMVVDSETEASKEETEPTVMTDGGTPREKDTTSCQRFSQRITKGLAPLARGMSDENQTWLDPTDLRPHPYSVQVYRQRTPSQRFIADVDEEMVNPLVVNEEGEIIDGVRRWLAAIELDFDAVKADVRLYSSLEEEKKAVLRLNDDRDETFSQKIRVAMEYEKLVMPALEKRMEAGTALDEQEIDPLLKSKEGENATALQLAGERVGWGETKYWQAKTIWEEYTKGNGRAAELIERIESEQVPESVNSAHGKLFPTKQPEEENTEEPSSVDPVSWSDGEYLYLPVLGFNEAWVANKRQGEEDTEVTTTIDGEELTWWEDDSIMPKHRGLLVNAVGFSTVNANEQDFSEILRYGDDQFVFADSGGYQLMSRSVNAEVVLNREDHDFKKCKIYPERLLEWQVQNADAGATLDYAPYNISGDGAKPDSEEFSEDWVSFYFDQKEWSRKMAERMSSRLQELRQEGDEAASDYAFCPVLHGKPHPESDDQYELVHRWHDEMLESSQVAPDGWVLKPEPSHSLGQVAFWLGYAAERLQEVDYIHVLMVGAPLTKALLMYYSILTGQRVTSDTSSYSQGGRSRTFDLPHGRHSTRLQSDHEQSAYLKHHLCRCPVCSTVEDVHGVEFVTQGTGNVQNATLNLHNLHQSLNQGRQFEGLLRRDLITTGRSTEFWHEVDSVDDNRVKELYHAMNYVRLAYWWGLDYATVCYRIPWSGSKGSTIELLADSTTNLYKFELDHQPTIEVSGWT